MCKQRKYALKQASLVLEGFIEQFVVDVDLTGLPFNIGIKGDILDKLQTHLTGKLLYISILSQTLHEHNHIFFVLPDRGELFFKVSNFCEQLPCERYSLYSEVYGTPTNFIREERFTMNGNLNPRYLKRGNIDPSEIVQRLTSYVSTNEQSPLEKALGLKGGRDIA